MYASEVWVCGRCREPWDHEDDARDCCRTEVHDRWQCSEYAAIHDTKDAANACCTDDEIAPLVSAADLEAAGQGRLL